MKATERAQLLMKKLEPDEPWTGPVRRLGELTVEERVQLGIPAVERRRSQVMIRVCGNPFCRHWTPTRLKRCVVCHT